MVTAILDTNVFIRAALRPELLNVLLLPEIRDVHGWSDDMILQFIMNLPAAAAVYPGQTPVPASLPRDITDVKFLSLAHEADADYLVTKDGRHLLRLKKYRRTKIVTPTQFLAFLS